MATAAWMMVLVLAAVDGGAVDPPVERLWTDGWDRDGGLRLPPTWGAEETLRWADDSFWDAPPLETTDPQAPGPDAGLVDGDGGVPDGAVVVPQVVVAGVTVKVDRAQPGEEDKLATYLGLERGDRVPVTMPARAERRLLELGGYRAVTCAWTAGRTLVCGVSPARTIHKTRVVGLPLTLLQAELDRRIFLRPGERLDDVDPRTADRVARQRKRVTEFLEQEGYFGGLVVVETPVAEGNPRWVDVVIRLEEQHRARVRNVTVRGVPAPWQGELRQAVVGVPLSYFRPGAVTTALQRVELRYRQGRSYPEAHVGFTWKLSRNHADVDVKVELGPRVEIRVENRTPLSTQQLRETLTVVDAGSSDDQELDASAFAMRDLLQRRGFHATHVTWKRQKTAKGDVITFHAHVGGVGVIKRVTVRGPVTLRPELVRSQAGLASQPQGFLLADARPPLWETPLVVGSRGLFTTDDVQADARRIERYMAQNGFPEATVVVRKHVDPADDGVVLEFLVEEGPRYLVKDVEVLGNHGIKRADVLRAAGVFAGRPFIPDALPDYEAAIAGAYARRGYLQARVKALTAFDPAGRTILRFAVDEGARARLSAIFVAGNARTDEGVLRRELGLREGAPLDPEAVSEAIGRLRRTGVFRRVNGRLLGVEDGRRDVALLVTVEERPARTVDAALAVSTSEYLSGSVELRDRNFGGTLSDLTIRAQLGPLVVPSALLPRFGFNLDPPQTAQNWLGAQVGIRSRSLGHISLRVPRLLGSPLNGLASVDAELRDRPVPAADPTAQIKLNRVTLGGLDLINPFRPVESRSFDQERFAMVGAQVGVEVTPWSITRLGIGYGFELFARQLVPSPNVAWDLGFPTRAGYVELRGALNAVDNLFDPKVGVLANARLRVGGRPLGGEGEFVVLGGQLGAYYTFSRVTFAASLRSTLVAADGGAGNKRIVPRRDLGLAGGDRSVRGYDEDAIRVQRNTLRRGVEPNNPRSIINEPGLYSFVGNAETRVAVLRNVGLGDVQLAAFVDGALVTDTLPPWSINVRQRPTEVGLGTGVGIRYVTPVGPISLDYGVDVLHLPRGRLHLLFGYTF